MRKKACFLNENMHIMNDHATATVSSLYKLAPCLGGGRQAWLSDGGSIGTQSHAKHGQQVDFDA